MNHTNISKILFMLFAAILCFGPVGLAEPVGTAFTYQGRLIDANKTADGLYDFQFKLFDANSDGNQLGVDVNTPEVNVIDGYFTVELDYGNVFDGNNRWLEIGVRPGDQDDPNVYTTLTPRQKVTPAPHALYAKVADSVTSGVTGSGTDNYIAKFIGSSTIGNSVIYESAGNVGIGTTSPGYKLDVQGDARATGGVRVGTDNGSCDTSKTGTLRYNAANKKIEYCDGTAWRAVGGGDISFLVYCGGSYNWPTNNTEQVINLNTFSYSNGGGFNTSTSTFTAPVSGIYTFHGNILFNNISAGDTIWTCIVLNGSQHYYGDYLKATGPWQSINVSTTVYLNQGNTVNLCGFVNASSPPARVGGSYEFTRFDGARVF